MLIISQFHVHCQSSRCIVNTLDILPTPDNQRTAFAEIWIPWLRDTMKRPPEPEDLAIMADPAAYYRNHGGEVFLAFLNGEVIGAVAVKSLGEAGFEFCELVVSEKARGRGAGRALAERCIAFAAGRGGPPLFLQSFNALDVALGLYRRLGFVDAQPPPGMSVLARTEVVMMKPV
jgi:putative acetyltransferase